jgi:hypothetical protein
MTGRAYCSSSFGSQLVCSGRYSCWSESVVSFCRSATVSSLLQPLIPSISSPLVLRSNDSTCLVNGGGLNGSTQHSARTHMALKTKLKSPARLDQPERYPGQVLTEYHQTDRFPWGSIVGSAD